ncbi:MAG TPA: ABC transporter ATP-binding protein [Fibrobacteria bacterium]|nr:ABC transporter ATP-binding protein [Fibrobacteria bacterium]HOX51539.1 ABC transporter ATP-binding protein [Fibrobacteria bacterium]
MMRLEAASAHVGGKRILSSISVSLGTGDLVAVIGPNGAGKSTLLKLMAGVLATSEGRVDLEGRPVREWSSPERACRMAYLPQFRPLTVSLPVEDLVSMGRLPHRGLWKPLTAMDRQAVSQAMDRMEIAHLRGRDATTLSGGELQRTFLARCLAQGSPLLLLDEPLTGLDIGHQLSLLSLLESLAREGRTVVWSVHDLRLAAEHSGTAWLLDHGALVDQGKAESVLLGERASEAFGVSISRSAQGDWRFG